MATKKKPAKRKVVKKEVIEQDNESIDETEEVTEEQKTEMRKLKDTEVNSLKGKLVEVRRIGVSPIFVECTRNDSIEDLLKKADVPYQGDEEIKIEGLKANSRTWAAITLDTKAYLFDKIAVTTKVAGGA